MFCAHLSHFGYTVHLLPERGFSYRVCDEEMPNPLLVLTLLKIISQSQWYISLSISYLLLIVYLNISKLSCIESISISRRIVLKITKIAVAIRFVQHPPQSHFTCSAQCLAMKAEEAEPSTACIFGTQATADTFWDIRSPIREGNLKAQGLYSDSFML